VVTGCGLASLPEQSREYQPGEGGQHGQALVQQGVPARPHRASVVSPPSGGVVADSRHTNGTGAKRHPGSLPVGRLCDRQPHRLSRVMVAMTGVAVVGLRLGACVLRVVLVLGIAGLAVGSAALVLAVVVAGHGVG
jgi:hypothetical protein